MATCRLHTRLKLCFLPRCMECKRGLAMRILSVRPSVFQTRTLWQNGRKICPECYTLRKTFSLVFWEKKVGGGRHLLSEILGPSDRFGVQSPYFQSIFARSAVSVTPSENISISTNRTSTTRFPINLTWSTYVANKPRKWGLKTAKLPISF